MKTMLSRIFALCPLLLPLLCWLSLALPSQAGQALLDFETSSSPVDTSYSDYGISFDGNEGVYGHL